MTSKQFIFSNYFEITHSCIKLSGSHNECLKYNLISSVYIFNQTFLKNIMIIDLYNLKIKKL